MSYRLLTYRDAAGPRAGIAFEDTVYDLAELSGKPTYASVRGLLDDWANAATLLAALQPKGAIRSRQLSSLELLPPIVYPGVIYCAGANYRDHVDNMARKHGFEPEPDPHDLGLSPWHFIKASWCAVGHATRVTNFSKFLDWEAELAVVIGRPARNVSMASAMDYVAAYTIGNDLSARDRIAREKVPVSSPFRYDWVGQKSFEGSCPLGPWLVPAADVGNPQDLAIRTYVNDVIKQDSNTGKMLFSIAEQISYLSSILTLHPGDVVLTGTPAGVGAETGECLKKGDRVRVEIEKLGQLVTDIA
jgi:2-keto-4-pentenoate hydratase/2-oxohepta-3-ene-1,7-dioic acid hydratase in catechol pathway